MLFLIGIGALGGITLVLTTLLVFANKKLHVEEDPRIDVVDEVLPQANCGACGYSGCRAFAEALVDKKVAPGACTVSSPDVIARIADYLGVAVGGREKHVVRLACAGGSNVARHSAQYKGLSTCRAAAQIAGGGKSCFWGCLGFGDCEAVCDFDAIQMNSHSLPIVSEDNCTACGDCVVVCPKNLFSLHPVSHRLWVTCKNLEIGNQLLDYCTVACTACGRCAVDAPNGLITMQNNLPVIDYLRDHNTKVPIERCPTGAIIWLEANGNVVLGTKTKRTIRQETLEDLPT